MHTVASCYIRQEIRFIFRFLPSSSACNNFRLPSNVCFGHVMLLKYVRTVLVEERAQADRQRWNQLMLISKSVEIHRNDDSV